MTPYQANPVPTAVDTRERRVANTDSANVPIGNLFKLDLNLAPTPGRQTEEWPMMPSTLEQLQGPGTPFRYTTRYTSKSLSVRWRSSVHLCHAQPQTKNANYLTLQKPSTRHSNLDIHPRSSRGALASRSSVAKCSSFLRSTSQDAGTTPVRLTNPNSKGSAGSQSPSCSRRRPPASHLSQQPRR